MRGSEIIANSLVKIFGSGSRQVRALDGISFEIKKGEFFAIIGPSGSGKTTLLKCLVGLEQPNSGQIFMGGKDMAYTPIHERNASLVFQNFGLFPHLNVYDNIAFGLSIRKYSNEKIQKEVGEIMRLTDTEGLGSRTVKSLSVGQQQRVALARSIVIKPNVVLYDEPLGNVDFALQRKMLVELKQIHRKIGCTSIYVTHDQEQAMVLANRIMIMNLGLIEQIGTPEEIYYYPNSIFVAKFVGEINMFKGEAKKTSKETITINTEIGKFEKKVRDRQIPEGKMVAYAIRPEKVYIDENANDCENKFEAEVVERSFTGSSVNYKVKIPNGQLFKASMQIGLEKTKKIKQKTLLGWRSEEAILLDKPSVHSHIDIDRILLGA